MAIPLDYWNSRHETVRADLEASKASHHPGYDLDVVALEKYLHWLKAMERLAFKQAVREEAGRIAAVEGR